MKHSVVYASAPVPVESIALSLTRGEFRALLAVCTRVGGETKGPRGVIGAIYGIGAKYHLTDDIKKYLSKEEHTNSVYLTDVWPIGEKP